MRSNGSLLDTAGDRACVAMAFGGALLLPLPVGGGPAAVERSQDVGRGTAHAVAPRQSLRALRDQHVLKQLLDYSSGAAALAILLRHYCGISM